MNAKAQAENQTNNVAGVQQSRPDVDKPTPGPWFATRFKGVTYRITENQFGYGRIAQLIRNKADAHLMAAAPELLAALEAYITDCGDYEAVMPKAARVKQFRNAIAKAKGE